MGIIYTVKIKQSKSEIDAIDAAVLDRCLEALGLQSSDPETKSLPETKSPPKIKSLEVSTKGNRLVVILEDGDRKEGVVELDLVYELLNSVSEGSLISTEFLKSAGEPSGSSINVIWGP